MAKMSELSARSKAAKGMAKGAPPAGPEEGGEDELLAMLGGGGGAPPPEAPPMPEEEIPMPEEGGMPLPGMEGEAGAPGDEESMDLDTALAGIEAAIGDQSPEVQEEIRTHLNAIRDLATGGAPKEEEGPAPETPTGDTLPPPPGEGSLT